MSIMILLMVGRSQKMNFLLVKLHETLNDAKKTTHNSPD